MWIQHEHISMAMLETASGPWSVSVDGDLVAHRALVYLPQGRRGASVNLIDDREQR